MRFYSAFVLSAFSLFNSVRGDAVPFERMNLNDTALLIVDIQVGLFQMVRDVDPTVYRQAVMAHAELGNVFDLPTIITTSTETGSNGPVPQEILDMYPEAPYISRQGEINAWDNADFRAAVKATGKTSFIIGGIVTDVCTAFLALSLRAEGYTVFANVEASGALSELASTTANRRMEKAGVHLVTLFAIVGDLMRSWSTFPNPEVLVPFMNKYFPIASMLEEGHNAAMNLTSA